MALVGVQVLFAFLLAVPFAQGFADVTNLQKALFFVVLCSTAIASALLVAPSAYHRINFRAKDKEQMLRTSNGLMIGGLVFVAVSIVGSVVLIADFIYSSTATTVACAVIGAALFVGLWFVLPVVRRDPEQTPNWRLELNRRSGCPDLNRGPPAPKAGALPSCATPRG